MSEPRSKKDRSPDPENAPGPDSLHETGLETPHGQSGHKVAPWTSEVPRVAGPAPVIELDGAIETAPVKPLGPRRLARLQREMAEHAQEIHQAEQSNAGQVDEDLLLKQQRFAELALRAAAANEQDRQDAQAALKARDAEQGHGAGAGPHATPGEETITVTFPQSAAAGSSLAEDPLRVDPGHFPSSPLATASNPHTVTINVVPAAPSSGERIEVEPHVPPLDDPIDSDAGRSDQDGAPGTPVRAVDAQGLDLLEPKDYKQRSGAVVALLVVLVLVIAALIALLIIFVL
ncbi:hypothetical protein IEE92_01605 [Kocuria sp. cx-116]|uniref:hypothetical protein n=1 Tax=Kocuria sp. cx-116 TaxID=2771378 RepID=UPI00168299CE|nr:hypothetical protein [Kocuria sp. cx-116]MBD2761263.1 hypothetical protein [Kocuria sp. cx-116]